MNSGDLKHWFPTGPSRRQVYFFHEAARDGETEIVRQFSKKYPEAVNERNSYGWTALIFAAAFNRGPVVEVLLKNGANTHLKDGNGRTALMCAAMSGHKSIVKLLLEWGASAYEKDNDGKTALVLAQEHKNPEIAALLELWLRPGLKRDLPYKGPLKFKRRLP